MLVVEATTGERRTTAWSSSVSSGRGDGIDAPSPGLSFWRGGLLGHQAGPGQVREGGVDLGRFQFRVGFTAQHGHEGGTQFVTVAGFLGKETE